MRRRFRAVIAVLALVAGLTNAFAFAYDQRWIWGAGVVTGSFITAIMALRDSPPNYIAQWEEGVWGEQATAKALRALEAHGWHILHDLQTGYGNLDHVVIGEGGVFLLDSKWITGRAQLIHDGYQVMRHEDPTLTYRVRIGRSARAGARDLNERIFENSRIRQWIQPVVVFCGDFDDGPSEHYGVTYVADTGLAAYLGDQPSRLTAEHAKRLAQIVNDAYTVTDLIDSH